MAWMVAVKVRGTKDEDIYSPELSEEDADAQVAAIRRVLAKPQAPDITWLAVSGKDIVSAHKIESNSGASVASWE